MKYTKENMDKRRKRVELSKKTFVMIIYIILIPVIFYNTMLIVQAATNPQQTPSVFGIKTFVIISGSMEPTLEIGDIVVIKEVSNDQLQKGDIISFRNGQSIVTHRINDIVKEKGGKINFETKGDNNNIKDKNYVKYADIEGKMIAKIPYVGKVALLLKNKLIIIIILMIFYMMYLHNAKVEDRRLMRKEKRRVLKEKYKK